MRKIRSPIHLSRTHMSKSVRAQFIGNRIVGIQSSDLENMHHYPLAIHSSTFTLHPTMNILLAITGGIAAYKTPDLVRRLQDEGHTVQCMISENGKKLVSVHALSAVSGKEVINSLWHSDGSMPHIDAPRACDVILVAPATANFLAQTALGLADDIIGTSILALDDHKKLIVAPAMNTVMWNKSIVQEHVATLRQRGVIFIDPVAGELACGEEGLGAMADAAVICKAIAENS